MPKLLELFFPKRPKKDVDARVAEAIRAAEAARDSAELARRHLAELSRCELLNILPDKSK